MRQARDRQRESIALSGSNPGKSVANIFRHRSSSKRGHELPPLLNDNKVFLIDDTDKAELFSDFFAKHLATESDPVPFVRSLSDRTLSTIDVSSDLIKKHITRSLHQYNVVVCCLSEVRLPDSGSREIKIPGVESHFTLYHSGPRDSSGRHGVAIALSQQADLALLAWEPVNDRMAYVRLKGHFTNISIVAVYAPTSAAEQRDKEAFYSQLQALVERLPRRDLLIVAGDWNGRTGPGDPTTSHLLGRFGL
ncbi:hypothetical protein SprV_0401736900 [Sparganum proliferum]